VNAAHDQLLGKRKEHHMKSINTAIRLIAVHLGLATSIALGADPMAALTPASGISLEFIGQG
jgi:hypothetical protein